MSAQPATTDRSEPLIAPQRGARLGRLRFMGPLWRRADGKLGLAICLAVLVLGLFGGTLAPYGKDETFTKPNPKYDPDGTSVESFLETVPARLEGPSWDHPLG